MKIAVTLVHNKSDVENAAQIESILALVNRVTDTITQDQFDEEGNVIGQETFELYHYQFKNVALSHEVRFYQVIPHGVTPPSNLDQLDSYKVFYGAEDSGKGETRFFNWGLKRGVDHGADISIYLKDPSALTALKLRNAIGKLGGATALSEPLWGKIATKRLLLEAGQIDETKAWNQAVSDLKTRITERGLSVD